MRCGEAWIEPWHYIQGGDSRTLRPPLCPQGGGRFLAPLVLKKVNLDSRVLRDTPFALERFDRTHVHDAFDWASGTIVAKDARIKDHLEFSWE